MIERELNAICEPLRLIRASGEVTGSVVFESETIGGVGHRELYVDGSPYSSYSAWNAAMSTGAAVAATRRATEWKDEERWYVARVSITAHGDESVSFDRVRPPKSLFCRQPLCYMTDLRKDPRPPRLVPGWMKVELAAFGCWDLVSDEPAFNDNYEPLVVPMTPESAGVPLPPGGEYALRVTGYPEYASWNEPLLSSSDYLVPPEPVDVRGWTREQRRVPIEEQATTWGRCRRGGHLKPAAFKKLNLAERWTALAALAPAGVVTLEPEPEPDTGVEIAPACRKAADTFPGVRLIDIPFGWSTDPDDGQPFAGNRYTYQPIQWIGRDGITIRIDPTTGAAGDVQSYNNGEPTTIAADAAEFWDTFTTHFEDNLQPALNDVLPDADGDPDDEYELATETVDTLISSFPDDA